MEENYLNTICLLKMLTLALTCTSLLVLITGVQPFPNPQLTEHSASELKSTVEFTVIPLKNKRSPYGPVNSGYEVELNAFGKTHSLKLRSPEVPFLHPNFDYNEVEASDTGEVVITKKTISKREIMEINEQIFVDPQAWAALKVLENSGEYHLEGALGHMRIGRDATSGTHEATMIEADARRRESDAIPSNEPYATARSAMQGPVSVQPEVAFTCDYANAKYHDFDDKRITFWFSILTNMINVPFDFFPDPKVKILLSGLYILKNETTPGLKFKPDVKEYRHWVEANYKDRMKHDIIAYLSGVGYPGGLAGRAFQAHACHHTGSCAGIIQYLNGGWENPASTFFHEIAHLLDVGDGPCWPEDITECAMEKMKRFITSTRGGCLFKFDNPVHYPEINGSAPEVVAKRQYQQTITKHINYSLPYANYSLDEYCQVRSGKNQSFMKWRIDCLKLDCRYANEEVVPEGTPCGLKGVCKSKRCLDCGTKECFQERERRIALQVNSDKRKLEFDEDALETKWQKAEAERKAKVMNKEGELNQVYEKKRADDHAKAVELRRNKTAQAQIERQKGFFQKDEESFEKTKILWRGPKIWMPYCMFMRMGTIPEWPFLQFVKAEPAIFGECVKVGCDYSAPPLRPRTDYAGPRYLIFDVPENAPCGVNGTCKRGNCMEEK